VVLIACQTLVILMLLLMASTLLETSDQRQHFRNPTAEQMRQLLRASTAS
jgi:hypothetical protein